MSEQTEKIKIVNEVPYLLCEEDMTYYPIIKKDEENGLTYTLDPEMFIYLPNLSVPTNERDIGRWGRMRKKYLLEEKREMFVQMFYNETITDHLIEINESAEKMMDSLTEQMAEQEQVNEELKAKDQMKWVGLMNNIQSRAEETVRNSLIYV